jgi:hypothetical protein
VRFERLVEGIQQYEKIQIIRDEFCDDPAMLGKLDALLKPFTYSSIAASECGAMVNAVEDFLNGGYNEK